MGIYLALENKWYSFLELIDKVVPITKLTDKIDTKIPSFLLFLFIVFILLIGYIFLFSGMFDQTITYDAEITVVSKIGLPLSGVSVELFGNCEDDTELVKGITNDEGKVTLTVCTNIQNITLTKEGYSTFREEIDIEVDDVFRLSAAPPKIKNITVLVKDEQENLLPNAIVNLVCDSNTTLFENQNTIGFQIEIPLSCSTTQLRVSAPGYKEKTKTLMDTDERITIILEKEIVEGKIIFETKTPTKEEPYVEIRLTDAQNKSFTEITDASGTKEVTLPAGEYTYDALSQKGESKTGEISIFPNSTERETIIFTDILVESKKALYVKIVDQTDMPITNAKISIYKDTNSFSSRNTNSLGEITPIPIDPDFLPAGTKFVGIIKAPGYETKLAELEIVDKTGSPQKIIMNQGGSTLKVSHIDDLSENVRDAFTTLYYTGFGGVFDSGISDSNGIVLFQNLPTGNYTLKSVYTKTDSEGEASTTLTQDAIGEVTIILITGSGKITFNFLNQTGSKVDTNFDFYETINGTMQNTITDESTRYKYTTPDIKSRTIVKLATTNPEYFPHQTINYKMSRLTQSKDVFLRELNSLPNNELVQMFLVGVYQNNPLTETFKSAGAINPGNTYYLYFDVILNNENVDYLVGNFKLEDTNILSGPITIENAYSIDGYTRVMKNNSTGFIIDPQSSSLVDESAIQANVTLQNQQGKKSIPIFLEIKVDENAIAEEKIPLYFQTRHGSQTSLLYKKDLIIGESICMFGFDEDCPAFLLSHYLKWNGKPYIPLEYNHTVLIGDTYKIKTTIQNLTDEDIGTATLSLSVPKDKLAYYTVGNDTNIVNHQVNLFPFTTTPGNETELNLIKNKESGQINVSIEKLVDGLDALTDYELNDNQISLKILNKEELNIDVIPNIIYKNSKYPFFYIKTKYKSKSGGVPAQWYIEKDGERYPGYEGMTDANGIEIISFDATPFDEGDIITFVAEDLNGNLPARNPLTVHNPFPPTPEIEPSCLKLKLPNGDYAKTVDIPYFDISIGESKHIQIVSECNTAKNVFIYTDVYVSENSFNVTAGEQKDITVTGNIRNGIYGAYPLQLIEIEGSNYKTIEHIDVVISGNSNFNLENAILDFRQTDIVSTRVENKYSGRKDNYYPQVSLSTSSASLEYNKPGNPETYTFNAKVTGHAIESIVYGFIKSDIASTSERGGDDYNPYNTPTAATENFTSDEATVKCMELVYDGEHTEKPEPDLPTSSSNTSTKIYTPSSVVPISGTSSDIIDTEEEEDADLAVEKKYKKASFVSNTVGATGTLDGSCSYEPIGEIDLGPTVRPSSYIVEYYYSTLADIHGTATPGAPRPPEMGANGTWYGVRELGYQYYKVISAAKNPTATFLCGTYLGDGATYVAHYVIGSHYTRGLSGGNIIDHINKTSSITTQVDFGRFVEWFGEQKATWEAKVTINPVEGAVYDVGAYSATPVPKWTSEDLAFGKATGQGWAPDGTKSWYTLACITPNGFVDPERTASAEAEESWAIKPQSNPLIEYSSSGNIMYQIPSDSIPSQLDVYLRNGHYYAEYIGVPEISSKNISLTFNNKSIQGSEYAIVKVRDWTGSSVSEIAFQVKLLGNEHNCFATDGTEGVTGPNYVPKLLFDWDWSSITSNQCDSLNANHTYCDGVQFNISLMKRLNEINNLLLEGKINDIPAKTVFYAYLIKDNYNKELLDDFVEYYSGDFLNATEGFTKYKKFIEDNKLNYEVIPNSASGTLLPYGGTYRVEIDIDRTNENLYSLFNGDNLNATIQVVLRPVERAQNYNPFYDTPFDGDIGSQRNGYGVSVDVNGLNLNNLLIADNKGTSTMKNVGFITSRNLATLDNEIVLKYNGTTNQIEFYPSQPTPVEATITGSIGNVNVNYIVEGTGASNLPAKQWKLISSTIGGAKCHDFEDDETTFVNETLNGTTHKLSWNGTKSGTIGLVTTFFTPKPTIGTVTTRITPSLGSLVFNSKAGLINADSIMLKNYDQQGKSDYDNLSGIFNMIKEEKLCMSKQSDPEIQTDTEMQIFWNPDYLEELTNSIKSGSGSSC